MIRGGTSRLGSLANALSMASLAMPALGHLQMFDADAPPALVATRSAPRGRRMQRERIGNKPGKYMPHQGAREMARRVRQITAGQIDWGQRA